MHLEINRRIPNDITLIPFDSLKEADVVSREGLFYCFSFCVAVVRAVLVLKMVLARQHLPYILCD